MKRELLAFCLMAIIIIAFAPPGSCSSPPIQQDKVYVIDQPATVNAPVQVAIEIMYVDVASAQLSPGYGLVCGFARNWPAQIQNLSTVNLNSPEYSFRTCYNWITVQNQTYLNRPYNYYQPRNGLTKAAA